MTTIDAGIDYIKLLIAARLDLHFGRRKSVNIPPLKLPCDGSPLALFFANTSLTVLDQLIIFLALAPELRPGMLEDCLKVHLEPGQELPAFGGVRGKQYQGILPTGQTALFLLAGPQTVHQLAIRELLGQYGPLLRNRYIRLLAPAAGEPPMSGLLIPHPELVERLLFGQVSHPSFSPNFPAQLLETNLEWDNLVLPERSLREIAYLKNYLLHYGQLAGDPMYGRHSRRGYRALFYGPPGTGKTLTATLLGKAVDKPVFRVDLSMVVSKWIGETEKNLSGLFDRAESKGWILFFDEADALFSKRGEVKESRDKYANQETSFLLQRVENYDGLCILATNFRQNLDKAFTRRFESIVPFTPPTVAERFALWQNMLPTSHSLAADVELENLASIYEMTGATIANAIRHAVYEAVAAGEEQLNREALLAAIRREYEKEDRLFPG